MDTIQEEHLGFLEKMVKMVEKYGLLKIFKALLVLAIFIYILYCGAHLDQIIEKISRQTIKTEQVERIEAHDRALAVRQSIKPKMDKLLHDAMLSMDADRVFVLEMHNGTNNTAGLPFIYGEMTYESVAEGIHHIDEDYQNLNLSRFSLPLYIENAHYWMGGIDELKKIDPKFASRLASNDVTYLAVIHVHGVKNELGFFGFTYCNGKTPKSTKEMLVKLMEVSQKLSTMLDSSTLLDDSLDEEYADEEEIPSN